MNVIDREKVPLVGNDARIGGTVVEINLMLEAWLLTALEEAACEQGMSAATMTRRLIRDYVYYADRSAP